MTCVKQPPDLITSHQPFPAIQDMLDDLTISVAQVNFNDVADILSKLTSIAAQFERCHVDSILLFCDACPPDDLYKRGMISLLSELVKRFPSSVTDHRFLAFIDETLKIGDIQVQEEVLVILFQVFTAPSDEVVHKLIKVHKFYSLVQTLSSLFKDSNTFLGTEFLLISTCHHLLELKFFVMDYDSDPDDDSKPKLEGILNILLSVSQDVNSSSLMVIEMIHILVAELIGENILDDKCLENCLDILINMCADDILTRQMANRKVLKHLTDKLKACNQIDTTNTCYASIIIKCLEILGKLCLQVSLTEEVEIMDTVYSTMSTYRDYGLIQNTGQQLLLLLFHQQPDLLAYIGQQHDQIPLATFVLGNVLMYGKCAQVLATSYQLLCFILTSKEVQSALGARNFHIAVDANMRYHRLDTVVWTLSYKILCMLCDGNIDMKTKLMQYGFPSSLLKLLHDFRINANNMYMVTNAISLVRILFQDGLSTVSDLITKQFADCVQNLWLDGYKLNEQFSETCVLCLVHIWGMSVLQDTMCNSLIALNLDCMDLYLKNIKIQKAGVKLLQLLSRCQLPRSAVLIVSKLFVIYQDNDEEYIDDEYLEMKSELVVLCYLIASNSEMGALWIAQSDLFLHFLDFYTTYKDRAIIPKLIPASMHALSMYKQVKNVLLEKASGAGSVQGVSCLLALGAVVIDTGIESALSQACKIKHAYIVAMLLEQSSSIVDLKTPLKVALTLQCPVIVGLLLKALNEGMGGSIMNCTDLGLHDLEAMWFQPLLEGLKVECDTKTYSDRKQGESLARKILLIGDELATQKIGERSNCKHQSLSNGQSRRKSIAFEKSNTSTTGSLMKDIGKHKSLSSDQSRRKSVALDMSESKCYVKAMSTSESSAKILNRYNSVVKEMTGCPSFFKTLSKTDSLSEDMTRNCSKAELIEQSVPMLSDDDDVVPIDETVSFSIDGDGSDEIDESLKQSVFDSSPEMKSISKTASYSQLSVYSVASFNNLETLGTGRTTDAIESARQLSKECSDSALKSNFIISVFNPDDPRIILDLRNGSHGEMIHDEGTLGSLFRIASSESITQQKSKTSHHAYPVVSQLPVMPENEEITHSAVFPRSLSIISIETTTSNTSEFSDVEVSRSSLQMNSTTNFTEFLKFDLSNNQISSIDGLLNLASSALYRLTHIQQLYLNNNCIKTLPSEILQYLPALQELRLNHNELKCFPLCVLDCMMLEVLDLSYNQITDVGVSTKPKSHISKLTEVSLQHNQLTEFPSSLCNALPEMKVLNLSHNQIISLPDEQVQLDKLEILDFSYNKLHSIDDRFASQIVQVNTLSLQGNKIEKLPSTKVGVKLNQLSQLDVSNNLLGNNGESALDFVASLSRLNALKMNNNDLTAFCNANQLRTSMLSELDLSHNRITKFDISTQVKAYSRLKKLNLSHNLLVKLSKEIGELSSLCILDISHNKRLTTLPDHMGKLARLWQLKMEGLKLDIDSSLLDGRTRDLVMYLHERLKKSVEYNQLKLMCVGYGGRGKSTLIRALMKQRRTSHSGPTVGVIVNEWRYRVSTFMIYNLKVWDFAGQEEFYSTHQCFMSDRALYMVVYNLSLGISEIENMKPWLQNIHARAPQCPAIVVGTHLDKVPVNQRDQVIQEIRVRIAQLCSEEGYPEVYGMVEVDCRYDNSRLDRLRVLIHDVITSHNFKGQPLIGQKVPASYVKLQDLLVKELNDIRGPFPVITQKRLDNLVEKANLDLDQEELKQAVRFLHTCGVILHYEDSTLKLNDFYFLDPEWLCRMMAQIITVREINPCIREDGLLKKQDINLLFTGKKIGEHKKYVFPSSLIPQYLVLLHKFEIALPLDEDKLLIPARLSPLKPQINLPLKDGLIHRLYSMNYIPAGLWSRLITRVLVSVKDMEEESISTIYWREGVYIMHSPTIFLLIHSPKENAISITGPPTSQGARLLGTMVDHLDQLIEEWYPGLLDVSPTGKRLMSVTVPCVQCNREEPHHFSLDFLINQSDVTTTVHCPRHNNVVAIKDLAPDVLLADIPSHYHTDRNKLQMAEKESSVLGDGSYSCVYKATYNFTPVAVKKYMSTVENIAYKALRQEASILSKIHHPSLVKMVAIDTQNKLLILELAPMGSLRSVLNNRTFISKPIQHRIALQIAEGLQYLHRYMIIFRDMKPDNILVFSLFQGQTINVKISDYGIACMVTPGGGLQSQEGTPGYRAPEVINRENYNLKADMFSYGVTIYELITDGKHPYGDTGFGYQLDENIAQGTPPQPIISHDTLSWTVMEDVIGQCLSFKPDNRPRTNDVISQLSDVESLCLRQTTVLSKQPHVDALIHCWEDSDRQRIVVACGGMNSSELVHTNMESRQSTQGSLFHIGHVLCMLFLSGSHGKTLILGTAGGYLYVVDAETNQTSDTTCCLGDSVLCLAEVQSSDSNAFVLAGTAGGRVAIFTAESIMKQEFDPEVLQLGSASEPVSCICPLNKPAVYITVATRIYRLRLHPKISLETKYYFDLEKSDEKGPIRCIVKYKSNLHVIKRWGHKLYKVSIRSTPYVKNTFNSLSHLHKLGIELQNSFVGRLQSMCVVQSKLWLGTANGCLLVVDSNHYVALMCLSQLGTEIRHLKWIPNKDDVGQVAMSYKATVQGNTLSSNTENQSKSQEVCCMCLWDADLDTQSSTLQQYINKRKVLQEKYDYQ